MSAWLRAYWSWLLLGVIVAGSAGLSLTWVFLVPIFQSPDEPHHLDFALCIYEHGSVFRNTPFPIDPYTHQVQDHYQWGYPCYFVHPYVTYLMDRTDHDSVIHNHLVPVPPGYGKRWFYQALDREAPSRDGADLTLGPTLLYWYPCGYYAVTAGWIALLRCFTHSLVKLVFGARILSVLMLVGSLLLIYPTLRELRCRRSFALLLTACIGFLPLTSFVSSYVQPDNFAGLLMCATFYLALRVRRQLESKTLWGLLGAVLGVLLITKQHYYLCAFFPVLAMLGAELFGRRQWLTKQAFQRVALFLAPSLLMASLHLWFIRDNRLPIAFPWRGSPPYTLYLVDEFVKALNHFYAGSTHDTFWGDFGWGDTPLIFRGENTTTLVRFLLHASTWIILGLTLLRLEQVISRLIVLARRGRGRLALRIACSNPAVNSFFLFTVMMFLLFIWSDNFFAAQGRNWFPFLMPMFLTAVVYAPRALTLRRVRRLGTACLTLSLLLYGIAGSFYAIKCIKARYYLPDVPMIASSVPIRPILLNQMTWKDDAGEGLGNDPFLVFKMDKPQFVYAVRLRYSLTNLKNTHSWFEAYWKDSTRNEFAAGQRTGHYLLSTSPEDRTLTICVNDTIDHLRLDPDIKPCHFRIRDLVLLEKPPDTGTAVVGRIGGP